MASGRRFLVFSKDSLFAEALKEQIAALPETKGLEVTSSFKEAVDLAKKDFFDAAIVNDSIELCEGLRKTGFDRTIILIAPASKEPEDDTSISDFIETPMRFTAFATRLYHCIISHENQDKKGFVVGYFTFNPKTKTAKSNLDSCEHQLTEKEADILTHYSKNNSQDDEHNGYHFVLLFQIRHRTFAYVRGNRFHQFCAFILAQHRAIEIVGKS